MSYDIYLKDRVTGKIIELGEPHHEAGGIYALGGTNEAWLNITYNYASHFYRLFGPFGIRSIYGIPARFTIGSLREAADKLGLDRDPDYWKPTEGNARAALESLIRLAEKAPDAIWAGN